MPRRLHVIATALVASGACKSEAPKERTRDAAVVAPAVPEKPAPRPPPAARATTAIGRRCVLDGDPLAASCSPHTGMGLALDAAGRLYVIVNASVRRYHRVEDGTPCHYAPDTEVALPPGAEDSSWGLVTSSKRDAVYAWEFMGGLLRVDVAGPKAEPACTDVNAYFGITGKGKDLLVTTHGLSRLVLGKHCKAVKVPVERDPKYGLDVVDDVLYNIAGNHDVVRYDGTKAVPFGQTADLCFIRRLTSCGDHGVCALDYNCPKIVQFAPDGSITRTLEVEQMFDPRPYSLADATTRSDGTLLVYARMRDEQAGKETCEVAIHELPAAAFAR